MLVSCIDNECCITVGRLEYPIADSGASWMVGAEKTVSSPASLDLTYYIVAFFFRVPIGSAIGHQQVPRKASRNSIFMKVKVAAQF